MSDILIKNMKLPKNYPYRLTLHPDGHVEDHTGYSGHGHYQAIEIPPHGILKDTDFMLECLEAIKKDYPEAYKLISWVIERTPTVLEASE